MKNNKKGFTLAELLIVVAIIAVLVAIAIPVFTKTLEKSREAADAANLRAAYAEVMTNYLTDDAPLSIDVKATQTQDNWQNKSITDIGGIKIDSIKASTKGWTVALDSTTGTVKFTEQSGS